MRNPPKPLTPAAPLTRRRLIHHTAAAAAALTLGACAKRTGRTRHTRPGVRVNDVHGRLNPTTMRSVSRPATAADVADALKHSARQGRSVSVAGARHAMGGQQFLTDGLLLDMRSMRALRELDTRRGVAVVEAGVAWPDLVAALRAAQPNDAQPWTIVQKQTGANELTVGGAVACNAHGRGLRLAPLVQQIEALEYVTPHGEPTACDRDHDPDTFARLIGGYGLFGVVTAVHLRLMRCLRVRREVAVIELADLDAQVRDALDAGAEYGDCQLDIDPASPGFLRRGVLATYHPTDRPLTPTDTRQALDHEAWLALVRGVIDGEPGLFDRYADFYRGTAGQVYDSDAMQMSTYLADYADRINHGRRVTRTLMLTELYVPVDRLAPFLDAARACFHRHDGPARPAYSVLRLIQPEQTTALRWATQRFACVIFNVVVEHNPPGVAAARQVLQDLIDRALELDGRYYLTYHRWARADQVRAAYPMMEGLLREKTRRDPAGVLQSDWYRHHATLLGVTR